MSELTTISHSDSEAMLVQYSKLIIAHAINCNKSNSNQHQSNIID